jgi:7-cyano-7-deazaguanine synthase
VVLLSGGLDSAVCLFAAKKARYACSCLIFDYGQRHRREIESAKGIARAAKCPYQILKISLPWKGSALLDKKIGLPGGTKSQRHKDTSKITSTYVPARNIVFLSFALSFAESIAASALFIGAHSQDYSGYPDCRPEFFRAFDKVIAKGTRAGIEKRGIEIKAPLLDKKKAQIIRMGKSLGVPFEVTWSCYRGGRAPCGECDSCFFRAKGFAEAGMRDPLLNATE